jgi:hypothetical protein
VLQMSPALVGRPRASYRVCVYWLTAPLPPNVDGNGLEAAEVLL